MNCKKVVVFLNILLLLIFSGCGNKVHMQGASNKNTSSKSKIDPVDKFLSKQKFNVSNNSDKQAIVYVYFPDGSRGKLKSYTVNNSGSMNIKCRVNQRFIISLHESSVIFAEWSIQNNIDNSSLILLKKTKLSVPFKNPKKLIGINYDRKNFYFMPLKKGPQDIILSYVSKNSSHKQYFNITVNVTAD
ncbi:MULTISPECIES: hypothetical protein [Clostridium]|uniref:hypothetical protein n=1 Tax=Clostridium TaxID=1485 RepID=UPI0008245096|nr:MULTISPECIES: hypothetical protein [Clostridium]PJI09520.1 hypothetical protein CUB90_17355 [Clostridium sp. CT7]